MNPALVTRIHELKDLAGVIHLAAWDQETFLPAKAHAARGSQLATLQGCYHQRLTDPALAELLAGAKPTTGDEAAMVRVLGEERSRAVKLPTRLVKELAEAQSQGLTAWLAARELNDFRRFQPALEKVLALKREQADAFGFAAGEERYDALLQGYEPGMRVRRLAPVLAKLTTRLGPLVGQLSARPAPKNVFAGKRFDVEAQLRFTLEVLAAMGFDLEAGRQDQSVHPFSRGLHPTDVRLTTRVDPENPLRAILVTLHEGGHGLYEQGFAPEHFGTPLAAVASMGLDESQSRLWENLVGRGRPFWTHFFPRLQRAFRDELDDVSLEDFLAWVNRVGKSELRGEADELTYNLHIALRFELELAMVRGELEVRHLEAAWNDKSQALLGFTPSTPLRGVLQDVHWSSGDFGYFPTYALGNLYAASLYACLKRQAPGLEERLARGELMAVRDWLRANVHREGYRRDAEEQVRRVTGAGLTDEDFLGYVTAKYGV